MKIRIFQICLNPCSQSFNDYTAEYTVNLTGLVNNYVYQVYITTENDWPAYNEYLNDTKVAKTEAKTVKLRSKLIKII